MTLDQIFGEGHRVARVPGLARFVVRCPKDGGDEGTWLVQADALPAVVINQSVEEADLGGELGETDARAAHWLPDESSCWCELCTASRKMLETQDE